MFEIHANDNFESPIEDVFGRLSDHERFLCGHGIDRCVVTKPGAADRNGLGAVREIFSGPLHFVEEIVRFEPPRRFDYVIRRVTLAGRALPLEHELGWVELQHAAGWVRVDWFSRFRVALPLIGGVVAANAGRRLGRTFAELLAQTKNG